jgi:hypothetical protein
MDCRGMVGSGRLYGRNHWVGDRCAIITAVVGDDAEVHFIVLE